MNKKKQISLIANSNWYIDETTDSYIIQSKQQPSKYLNIYPKDKFNYDEVLDILLKHIKDSTLSEEESKQLNRIFMVGSIIFVGALWYVLNLIKG